MLHPQFLGISQRDLNYFQSVFMFLTIVYLREGKVRCGKVFSKLVKLFPRNSKVIVVLSTSLLKCDKSTLKLPLP